MSSLLHVSYFSRPLPALLFIITVGYPATVTMAQQRAAGSDSKTRAAGQASPFPSGSKPNSKGEVKESPEEKGNPSKGESKGGTAEDSTTSDPKIIRRDETIDGQADPSELNAMVGEDGRVAFEFRNQPWVALVQWLAEISDQPLDWLELPGDRVNLRSPGRYTVEETRDLFNRYLLARGYTLLEIDGGLTVAKTESINPAIVPRINADELATLQPYTFVRTSLDVGWLSAEKLAEELEPMISGNGRLTALSTTNRIEAMDAAVNLRQIAQLLEQERSSASLEALAPEFKLRYLPAEEAKQMLEQFLGIEKKQSAALTPQQIQMMQQQMRNQKSAPPQEKKVEVSVVANVRQNSVIIRAPADRVAIAMEFLKRVDVPSDAMTSLADIETRVQVFRLSSLDPEKLIEIVSEMNILEPTTRVRVDKDNNALIVSGSAADRYIIDSLIKRLDGSGRSFEVLPLRRLDPKEVAESIEFLMGQKDKDDDKNSSRRSYYYGYYGRGEQEETKKKDEFRVAANSRYRQVMLWANEQEMAEVRSLLVKLGELPPPGGSTRTVRSIDASATPETYEYLQRLRQQWNRLSPNPLELPDATEFKEPNEIPDRTDDETKRENGDQEEPNSDGERAVEDNLAAVPKNHSYQLAVMLPQQASEAESSETETTIPEAAEKQRGIQSTARQSPQDAGGRLTQNADPIRSADDFDRLFGPADTAAEGEKANRPPTPVRIEIDSSGNLVLSSSDTEALDRLENLMLQISPPKRPYQVFHIEHASASWMRLNLEDYFQDMEEGDSSSNDFYRWYYGFGGGDDDDSESSGLGTGAKLRFVDDLDTNTLVVNGATNEQLRTISELIELWDVPEPVNKRKTRFTRLVNVNYGKADKIAETVKEAYRDLLSSNDKAFAANRRPNQGGGKNETTKSRDGEGSGLESSDSGRNGGADFSFKGKLSLGIDTVGNTLLVSAEGEPLLELVTDMIQQLDEAAQPQGEVQVFQLPGGISGQTLQDALQPIGIQTTMSPRRRTPSVSKIGAGEQTK